MLRRRTHNNQDAQVFLEYTIVIGAVVLILFAMSTMIKRGTQGMIKVVADQIGRQENADQRVTPTSGYLINSYTTSRATIDKTRDELLGVTNYIFADVIRTATTTELDLGFTNED